VSPAVINKVDIDTVW